MLHLAYTELSTLSQLPKLQFQTTSAHQTVRTSMSRADSLKVQEPETAIFYLTYHITKGALST